MTLITNLLVQLFYRPLLNAFVLLHQGLTNLLPFGVSAGVTLIVATLLIKVITSTELSSRLFGLTDREQLSSAISDVQHHYQNDQQTKRKVLVRVIRDHSLALVLSFVAIAIQIAFGCFLYFFFRTDANYLEKLLYSAVPIPDSFNTVFLGIDLTLPNTLLTLSAALLLFLQLKASRIAHPYEGGKSDVAFQYLIPVGLWLILRQAPAALALAVLIIAALSFGSTLIGEMFKSVNRNLLTPAAVSQGDKPESNS